MDITILIEILIEDNLITPLRSRPITNNLPIPQQTPQKHLPQFECEVEIDDDSPSEEDRYQYQQRQQGGSADWGSV
jgi:hypothetical protein